MKSKAGGKSLQSEMGWARKEILQGREVWAIRTRRGGMVVEYVSAPDRQHLNAWLATDVPVEEMTLTQIVIVGDEARWGIEQPWPGSQAAIREQMLLESKLRCRETLGIAREVDNLHNLQLDVSLAACRPPKVDQ